MPYAVAIDGPAGAGKSTIARLVAKKKGFIYVDTGAMYRAIALFFTRQDVSEKETQKIQKLLGNIHISITYENHEQQIFLNEENVTSLIRSEKIGKMASLFSANPDVREKLTSIMRQLADNENIVMDGRDIGTKVLPNANVKIYLTASSKVRAKRRYLELKEKGVACTLEDIEKDIIDRDYQDMHRAVSPLKKAADAMELDSSNMTIEECCAWICDKTGGV